MSFIQGCILFCLRGWGKNYYKPKQKKEKGSEKGKKKKKKGKEGKIKGKEKGGKGRK